eukprot:5471743-Alexandrium_andersonii.AAC.1
MRLAVTRPAGGSDRKGEQTGAIRQILAPGRLKVAPRLEAGGHGRPVEPRPGLTSRGMARGTARA